MGRSNGRIQDVLFLRRIAGNRWRSNWFRVKYFPSIFVIADSLKRSRMICENGTSNLRHSQTGSSSCQRSTTSIGQQKETKELVFRNQKVKEYAKRFSKGHWTFLGRGDEKKWYGTLLYTHERQWDTCHPVFKSISALNCGIPKKKNNRDSIHFNADASNTELLFRIIHTENQLTMYVAVSNWCVQFGLTEDKKGEERQKESVTKGVFSNVNSYEVKLLVSSPRRVSGNGLRENIQDFESQSETIRFTWVCELASFQHRVSAGTSYKTRQRLA